MNLRFFKYQGTGNDFVLIDNRKGNINLGNSQVRNLCDRRFGIGADGLMLLQEKEGYDFEMVYFNSDGKRGSMCGNGARCIIQFAYDLGIEKDNYFFLAPDGPHEAIRSKDSVKLKMKDVSVVEKTGNDFFLDTGSPHYVKVVENLDDADVVEEGRKIRYNERFSEKGTNVNFIRREADGIFVRTYERGVEDETFSCGTGVTACALVASILEKSTSENHCNIITRGGRLRVWFNRKHDSFSGIWLEGPAEFVFKGEISVEQ